MHLDADGFGSIVDLATEAIWPGHVLAEQTILRADRLRKKGIHRGDRILVAHGGSASFFADLFAIWNLGACAVCINPKSKAPEIQKILELVQPQVAMVTAEQLGIADLDVTVIVDQIEPGERRPLGRGICIPEDLDDNALVLFTSGTTGRPKGVAHTFRSLTSRIALNRKYIPLGDMQVSLSTLPTHFGHGLIGNSLTPLLSGRDLIIAPGSNLDFATSLGEIIDQFGVTFMSSVPSMWKLVTKYSRPPRERTLRRIHIGSAPLSAELWNAVMEWAGIDNVVNMYGLTETANWVAGSSALDLAPEDGLVGRMWGGTAAILTEEGDISPQGIGEVILQTPSLMAGYFGEKQSLNERHTGWYHTGDIGSVDDDGVIRIIGRKKFEINRAGLKINPEDVEILLERHPMVDEACAFPVPDDISGEMVGVAIVIFESAQVELADLRDWCREFLVDEKIPEKWFVVSKLEKNDRGKLDRMQIMASCLETA